MGFLSRVFGGADPGSQQSSVLAVEAPRGDLGRQDLEAMSGLLANASGASPPQPDSPRDVGDVERLDEVESILRAAGKEKVAARLRLVRELNERDAADTSPVPEDCDIVWRVECPCCSSGPVTMWPWGPDAAMAHFSPDPSDPVQRFGRGRLARISRDGGRGTMADLPASGPEFLPMYANGAGMSVVRDPSSPEGQKWFPDPYAFRRMGFEWAAYAVPPGASIDGEHETVIDRTRSRRLGLLPLDEGGETGGARLAFARERGDELLRDEKSERGNLLRARNAFVPLWPTEADLGRLARPKAASSE